MKDKKNNEFVIARCKVPRDLYAELKRLGVIKHRTIQVMINQAILQFVKNSKRSTYEEFSKRSRDV